MPNIDELHSQQSKAIFRSHLRKIVEIYDQEWRVLHELIQNAVDATQADDTIQEGCVTVNVDFDEDEISVSDNGIGFAHDLNLLTPGGTGKEKRLSSRSPSKGYQGVGLKAVMYSSDRFELTSTTSTEEWTFLAENLRRYVDPGEEIFTPDYDEEVTSRDNPPSETGTIVTVKFPEKTVLDTFNNLSRSHTSDSMRWQSLYEGSDDPISDYISHYLNWHFRTKSYLACYNRLLNIPVRNPETNEFEDLKPTTVEITLKCNNFFSEVEGPLGKWLQKKDNPRHRVKIPYKAWDFASVAKENLDKAAKYRIAPELVLRSPSDELWDELTPTFRDKFLDLKLKPNEKASDFRTRYQEFITLLERPRSRVKAEDFRDIFPRITGIYLAIGRTGFFEDLGFENKGQRLIASNGTPTEHALTVRSTSSTWYLETMHFIVNVDATLNIGKRHLVDNRLVGRIYKFFEACYPNLVRISKFFVERDSGAPSIDHLPEVSSSKRIHRRGICIRRFPNDENTLLGLFTAAMGQLDPTFSLYGLFSKARYDGKFSWTTASAASDAELKVTELKVRLEDLVAELELATHDKEFTDLDLIVVWDRTLTKPNWFVKGISEARRGGLEASGVPTELVEYLLEDGLGRYRPLICVPDLLLTLTPHPELPEDDLQALVESMA